MAPQLLNDSQINELAQRMSAQELDLLCYCRAPVEDDAKDGSPPPGFALGISLAAARAGRDIYVTRAHGMDFWFIGTVEEITLILSKVAKEGVQETLWINILGFASGRTGWVLTSGGPPYKDGWAVPTDARNGIVCRFTKEGVEELKVAAKYAKRIHILSYGDGDEHSNITKEVFAEALDPWNIAHGMDELANLMPQGDTESETLPPIKETNGTPPLGPI